MREHAEKILRIVCWVLVALLLLQLGRAMVRSHPFARVTIPAVPTLTPATNAAPSAGPNGPMSGLVAVAAGTNHSALGTNRPGVKPGTNVSGTNLAPGRAGASLATNFLAQTNLPVLTNAPLQTNGVMLTNVLRQTNLPVQTNVLAGTNVPAQTNLPGQTNLPVLTNAPGLTNSLVQTNAAMPGTNGATGPLGRTPARSGSARGPVMGPFGPGMGMGQPMPELPPEVRARIDKIVESELLAPVIHPQPMALLGIAGDVAFLRTGDGQTGMVKVGDSLGDLKLTRIGINRVLVEENGKPQELTIFSGMGGESLLNTPDKNSNETNHP